MSSARLAVAGVSSNTGKTSITVGLIRALRDTGVAVQPYKVGPDYLDPQLLTAAAGRTCYNLDSWMTPSSYMRSTFSRLSEQADVSIVEGVMGLFDGADPTGQAGSTAEIAQLLEVPVLLVVNTHGMGGSIAALVKGFSEFRPGVRVAGVIANHCGSSRHAEILGQALDGAGLPPLVGSIPRGALPGIPDRHLGLLTPGQECFPENVFEALAVAVAEHLDLERIRAIAQAAPERKTPPVDTRSARPTPCVRIGVARDKAFHFYYPDNLQLLEQHGAELVPFSPLTDPQLPERLDGIYIGGGYPEAYADALAQNESMRHDVRRFAEQGKTIYAECGGLMYLSQSLVTADGERYSMAGALPVSTRMGDRRKRLGYVEATLTDDCLLGPAGSVVRGHEFHYSEEAETGSQTEWTAPYHVRYRSGKESAQGYRKGRVMASYVHLHFGSHPELAYHFVNNTRQRSS